jgi:hypothetical protein
MAKGNAAGHQPLSYRDRLRLNAAIKHLRSRFHSVRIAAHKEIQQILHKKRGIRRLREWVAKTSREGVRKVTPKPLHRVIRVKAAPAQAKARTSADQAPAPMVREMPKQGLRAPGGFGQTTADLKERTRAAHRAARGKDPQAPARVPAPGQPQPARMQAPAPSRGKTAGKPAPTLQAERAAARDPWEGFGRPLAAAPLDAPLHPLPSDVKRESRPSRIRLPRLIRARS